MSSLHATTAALGPDGPALPAGAPGGAALPANTPAPASRPLRFALKNVIAGIVVAGMLLLGATVMVLSQVTARQALLATTAQRMDDVGALVAAQTARMLEPGRATLRQLAFDPLASTVDPEARLERVFVLAGALRDNRLLSAIYLGYEDGDFLLVRRLDHAQTRTLVEAPAGAAFLAQSVATGRNGLRAGEFLFYDDAMRLVARRPQPDYRFDPRGRFWYGAARDEQGEAALSKPYVFFTTREVGMSLSQVGHGGRAVVGVDVVLDDLARYLGDFHLTPGAETALVDPQGRVVAYSDMERVLVKQGDDSFGFRSLDELGVESLRLLHERPAASDGKAHQFSSRGQDWIGTARPFRLSGKDDMQLLLAAPADELAASLREQQARMFQLILLVGLFFLPVGWWAGKRIGESLDELIAQARRISRFDFRPASAAGPGRHSRVSEVHELSSVMDSMVGTIDHFLQLSQLMATETDMERMLAGVLRQLVETAHCEAGAVYLWHYQDRTMDCAARAGTALLPERRDYREDAAPGGRSGPRAIALGPGRQQVELELRARDGALQGLLVLQREGDGATVERDFAEFAERLSGMLAVSIETRQLVADQRRLLDGVIRLMADAIDAKSPYTGGHCERVPELAMRMVEHLDADRSGPYRDFSLTPQDRYAFYLGAWLHDCGKVTSPEHIIDKATKLELIHNRIHEVRMRFEVLWRDAEIACLRQRLEGSPEADLEAGLQARRRQLTEDFAFVAQCNLGGEFMADEAVARLHAIGAQTWQRHFDNRAGLSPGELRQMAHAGDAPAPLPATEALLADRPEHTVPWGEERPPVERGDPRNTYGFDMVLPPHRQNMGELHNLAIRRGTLTDEDRFRINDHIVQTYVMLRHLPWPRDLARVPEIAATHHEKLDGRGYPRRLGAEQLTLFDRVMAMADVFEALTAADRPYKPPKTLSESLRIMAFMCKDQHLDGNMFRHFLRSDVWLAFARDHLLPAQIDEVDVEALERLLPQA